jgi:hypothetical protein
MLLHPLLLACCCYWSLILFQRGLTPPQYPVTYFSNPDWRQFRGDYRQGMDWWMDLLTTYTHHSELQQITVTLLISAHYSSLLQTISLLQPTVSSTAISWERILTVEILQLLVLRSFLSSEYPANELSQFPWTGLGSLVYSPGADLTESTVFDSSSIVAVGGYLVIARILLTCLPAVTKQCMFLLRIIA